MMSYLSHQLLAYVINHIYMPQASQEMARVRTERPNIWNRSYSMTWYCEVKTEPKSMFIKHRMKRRRRKNKKTLAYPSADVKPQVWWWDETVCRKTSTHETYFRYTMQILETVKYYNVNIHWNHSCFEFIFIYAYLVATSQCAIDVWLMINTSPLLKKAKSDIWFHSMHHCMNKSCSKMYALLTRHAIH